MKTTRLSLLILSILQTHNGWVTRRQIGAALHRPSGTTNPHDNLILDRLVVSGEIEMQESVSGAKVTYEYRIARKG